MKAIPEEFYMQSGAEVVTPHNFETFMDAHADVDITWDFQEQFSGSGRLSSISLQHGLATGFPVDLRYGWDLNNTDHQQLLVRARTRFKPRIKFSAPDCRHWGVQSSTFDKEYLEQARQEEYGQLEWLFLDNKHQHDQGLAYGNENPDRSAIFVKSPLAKNCDLNDNRRRKLDQRRFGAVSESHLPIRKSTLIDTNIKLRRSENGAWDTVFFNTNIYRAVSRARRFSGLPRRLSIRPGCATTSSRISASSFGPFSSRTSS